MNRLHFQDVIFPDLKKLNGVEWEFLTYTDTFVCAAYPCIRLTIEKPPPETDAAEVWAEFSDNIDHKFAPGSFLHNYGHASARLKANYGIARWIVAELNPALDTRNINQLMYDTSWLYRGDPPIPEPEGVEQFAQIISGS